MLAGFSALTIMQSRNDTITAVGGIKVGHHTLAERPTGCTVILAEAGAVAGVDVRGGAPGTRETDLLNPTNLVQQVHAIVLAGGSAFGLAAADGVIKYLEEKRMGFPYGGRVIPIVPAAILFDLSIGDAAIRPGPDCGYAAARTASTAPVAEGNVGAGAGATVGKWLRGDRGMKGGIGSAAIQLPGGIDRRRDRRGERGRQRRRSGNGPVHRRRAQRERDRRSRTRVRCSAADRSPRGARVATRRLASSRPMPC